MRNLLAGLALAGLSLAAIVPEQNIFTAAKGDPFTDPQAGINELQLDINDVIKNLAQGNTSEAILDYVFTRSYIQRTFGPMILPDSSTGCKGTKVGSEPSTLEETIALLRKAQVALQVLSRDLTAKADLETLRQDLCAGLIAPVWGAGCYNGDQFGLRINGTFNWICPKFRYNASAGIAQNEELASQQSGLFNPSPELDLEAVAPGNPYTDPQAGILYTKRDINYLLQDFAQNNISEAIWDYIPLRVFIAGTLADEVLPDVSCRGYKIGPYPNTTTEVIQSLQKVQLSLDILSQDLISKAKDSVVQDHYCAGVLGPFYAASCFEGGGFAKVLNGTFEPPARWICKQYRYNGTSVMDDVNGASHKMDL